MQRSYPRTVSCLNFLLHIHCVVGTELGRPDNIFPPTKLRYDILTCYRNRMLPNSVCQELHTCQTQSYLHMTPDIRVGGKSVCQIVTAVRSSVSLLPSSLFCSSFFCSWLVLCLRIVLSTNGTNVVFTLHCRPQGIIDIVLAWMCAQQVWG